ncbi:MAG: class I SAM-dependent methyltransferase [Planctomycetota bacterium]
MSDLATGEFTRRTTCRVCHAGGLATVLDYGRVPLAGNFLLPEAVGTEKLYPMDLSLCPECSLLQISNVVSGEELFTDYRYLSSVTGTLMSHFREYAAVIDQLLQAGNGGNAGGSGRGLVVEFGCNDGVLLAPLKERGVRAVGVDAAENVVARARARGLDVVHGFFGPGIAQQIRGGHGAASLITASNVFAHIDDMDAVMQGVDTLLAPGGVLAVEVHYVVDLLEQVQFETVYHEHLCYYSAHALERLFERFGMTIADIQRLPMHGGAIRVFARRRDDPKAQRTARAERLFELEAAMRLHEPEGYARFAAETLRRRDAIRRLVLSRKRAGRSVCGYGAAGRATTLLNYCGLDHTVLDYIVDESPSRVGRYVPGVATPIVPREAFHARPTDDCLLTAWNYREEIIGKEGDFLAAGGTFLAPLPEIEIIEGPQPCRRSA